jgi:hypothetical protein
MSRILNFVISRDGKMIGAATGGSYECTAEGCRGLRVGVRWANGSISFPCTMSLRWFPNRTAQIGTKAAWPRILPNFAISIPFNAAVITPRGAGKVKGLFRGAFIDVPEDAYCVQLEKNGKLEFFRRQSIARISKSGAPA